MAVTSDRIVKRFYIGGNQDNQAGSSSSNEGYETFEAAVEAIDAIYNSPIGSTYNVLYVFESFRILREV